MFALDCWDETDKENQNIFGTQNNIRKRERQTTITSVNIDPKNIWKWKCNHGRLRRSIWKFKSETTNCALWKVFTKKKYYYHYYFTNSSLWNAMCNFESTRSSLVFLKSLFFLWLVFYFKVAFHFFSKSYCSRSCPNSQNICYSSKDFELDNAYDEGLGDNTDLLKQDLFFLFLTPPPSSSS